MRKFLRPLCWVLGHRWHVWSCKCCAFCKRCHITDEETSLGRAFTKARDDEDL